MPRKPRYVAAGLPYHVTIRGVDRCQTFFTRQDRETYLGLVQRNLAEAGVRALAWCLMSNHAHWVVVPEREDSLKVLFRRVNGRYAQYLNARRGRSGHLWERRFFSCVLEDSHLWTALRYVERNPVRAGMVVNPWSYRWSSCAVHLELPRACRSVTLDPQRWSDVGGARGWRELLGVEEPGEIYAKLRRATYSGAPFGSEEFLDQMSRRFNCQWRPVGRPKKKPAQNQKGDDGDYYFCAV
jgi:putative transposase